MSLPIRPSFLALCCLSLLTACGGGGGGSATSTPVAADEPTTETPITPEPTVNTGVFVDSAVQGLRYETATQSGVTNAAGEFSYIENETVTFSIGGIHFPSVNAQSVISPLDVFTANDVTDTRVQNMARLLQSLDADGMAENGITLLDAAHTLAAGLTVDFGSVEFDQQVNDLVANSGAYYTALIDAQSAMDHLNTTLGNPVNIANCDVATDKVGYTGQFTNFAHGVSGTATVVDSCTIEITMFNFDGNAPNVRIYTGDNLSFTGDKAYPVSDRLDGMPWVNQTLTLNLPSTISVNDFDSLSVWCVEFAVDFGSLQLMPPS